MHDYYLDLDQITDEEELKYVKIGREAVQHLLKELPLEKVWIPYKQTKGCEMFIKRGGSPYSCFRVNVEFDFPPALVLEHCKDIPKRMSWDDGYESLKFLREFSHQTFILHVNVKAQWPLGPRDVLLVF